MKKWLIRMLAGTLVDQGWTPPGQHDQDLPMEKRTGKIARKVARLLKGMPDLDRHELMKALEQAVMKG